MHGQQAGENLTACGCAQAAQALRAACLDFLAAQLPPEERAHAAAAAGALGAPPAGAAGGAGSSAPAGPNGALHGKSAASAHGEEAAAAGDAAGMHVDAADDAGAACAAWCAR
jgi:hypothetical protein